MHKIMELNFNSSAERVLLTHGIRYCSESHKSKEFVNNKEVDNKAEKDHTYITQVTFIVKKV